MQVTKTSTFTGRTHTMELDVTQAQLDLYAQGNELIQNVFPNLNPDEREFIKTGVTPEEWNAMFGGDEDDQSSFFLLTKLYILLRGNVWF